MEFYKRLPLMLFLSTVMSLHAMSSVEGSCTVQNNSGKKVIIAPVDVSVSIEVEVGASVSVPPSQQHCYFKNADSGHATGPVTLLDGTLVVIVDGAVSGTLDAYIAVVVLGVLQLRIEVFLSL